MNLQLSNTLLCDRNLVDIAQSVTTATYNKDVLNFSIVQRVNIGAGVFFRFHQGYSTEKAIELSGGN